eukprot:TRINITY_DN10926_c0_g1_i2.p1 TRINITY_DN10926_c0_g1~~TRINITY_DN10926_c0_g1_i2.p1  ORF type:complete len:265 (+),score=-17.70 TRINITY_DN10926_c0_g1_i2:154-948(+)
MGQRRGSRRDPSLRYHLSKSIIQYPQILSFSNCDDLFRLAVVLTMTTPSTILMDRLDCTRDSQETRRYMQFNHFLILQGQYNMRQTKLKDIHIYIRPPERHTLSHPNLSLYTKVVRRYNLRRIGFIFQGPVYKRINQKTLIDYFALQKEEQSEGLFIFFLLKTKIIQTCLNFSKKQNNQNSAQSLRLLRCKFFNINLVSIDFLKFSAVLGSAIANRSLTHPPTLRYQLNLIQLKSIQSHYFNLFNSNNDFNVNLHTLSKNSQII